MTDGTRPELPPGTTARKPGGPSGLDELGFFYLLGRLDNLESSLGQKLFNVQEKLFSVRQEIKAELFSMRQEIKAEISGPGHEVKTEFSGSRQGLKAEFSSLRRELACVRRLWICSFVLANLGVGAALVTLLVK